MIIDLCCMSEVLDYCQKHISIREIAPNKYGVKPVTLDELYQSDLAYRYEKICIMHTATVLAECEYIKVELKYPANSSIIQHGHITEVTISGNNFYNMLCDNTFRHRMSDTLKNTVVSTGRYFLNIVSNIASAVVVNSIMND